MFDKKACYSDIPNAVSYETMFGKRRNLKCLVAVGFIWSGAEGVLLQGDDAKQTGSESAEGNTTSSSDGSSTVNQKGPGAASAILDSNGDDNANFDRNISGDSSNSSISSSSTTKDASNHAGFTDVAMPSSMRISGGNSEPAKSIGSTSKVNSDNSYNSSGTDTDAFGDPHTNAGYICGRNDHSSTSSEDGSFTVYHDLVLPPSKLSRNCRHDVDHSVDSASQVNGDNNNNDSEKEEGEWDYEEYAASERIRGKDLHLDFPRLDFDWHDVLKQKRNDYNVVCIFDGLERQDRADDIYFCDRYERSILHELARRCDKYLNQVRYVVEYWERHGMADMIYKKDRQGQTAFHNALYSRESDAIAEFLSQKIKDPADIDILRGACAGPTATLHGAIELVRRRPFTATSLTRVKLLVRLGADIDAPNQYHETPLEWAYYLYDECKEDPKSSEILLSIMEYLLEEGACPTIKNKKFTIKNKKFTLRIPVEPDKHDDESDFDYAERNGLLDNLPVGCENPDGKHWNSNREAFAPSECSSVFSGWSSINSRTQFSSCSTSDFSARESRGSSIASRFTRTSSRSSKSVGSGTSRNTGFSASTCSRTSSQGTASNLSSKSGYSSLSSVSQSSSYYEEEMARVVREHKERPRKARRRLELIPIADDKDANTQQKKNSHD